MGPRLRGLPAADDIIFVPSVSCSRFCIFFSGFVSCSGGVEGFVGSE